MWPGTLTNLKGGLTREALGKEKIQAEEQEEFKEMELKEGRHVI